MSMLSRVTSPSPATPLAAAGGVPVAGLARPAPVGLSGLHARVLEQLGTALCGRALPAGSVLFIDELARRHAVSRSVIREVLRVLASMGLVTSRRRTGTVVLAPEEWNVYDPQVIRWRLASADRLGQLRSLTEVRSAVEPHAARLAAERAPLGAGSDLVGLAAKLWAAGQGGDPEEFLRLDIEFHRQVLLCSGNEMFVKLSSLVAEVLVGRQQYGLVPQRPAPQALQLHVDVASAIQRHEGGRAHDAMVSIMERAFHEMSTLWTQSVAATASSSP